MLITHEVSLRLFNTAVQPHIPIGYISLYQCGSMPAAQVALRVVRDGMRKRDRSHYVWGIVQALQKKYPSVGFMLAIKLNMTNEVIEVPDGALDEEAK